MEEAKQNSDLAHQRTTTQQLFSGLEAPPKSLHISLPTPTPRNAYPQLVRDYFTSVFRESEYSFADLLPCRIAVVQRLVREMARHRSLIGIDEPLSDRICESFDDDISNHPRPLVRPDMSAQYMRPLSLNIFAAMKRAESLPPEWHTSIIDPETFIPTTAPGVALFPPTIPARFHSPNGGILPEYDPFQDEALLAYIEILAATAEFLQIEAPPSDPATPEAANIGRYGMMGLLAPDAIRAIFPSRFQIIAAEQYRIEHVLEILTDRGPLKARQELDRKHGLAAHEAASLCRLAVRYAREVTEMDLEDHKALMMTRLDGFIGRAREALDLRAELMAVKTMSIVLGLAKTESEDTMKDIIATVRKVSNDRESSRLLIQSK